MACIVCGIETDKRRCRPCHEVFNFVSRLTPQLVPDYIVIVDGSVGPTDTGHADAGAGLVLAREYNESVVACVACAFKATSSDDAELEAIKRATWWAPLDFVWSDNKNAINIFNSIYGVSSAKYIRPHMRDPLHNLAHRLANIGRQRAWDRLDRIWLPGEVWP